MPAQAEVIQGKRHGNSFRIVTEEAGVLYFTGNDALVAEAIARGGPQEHGALQRLLNPRGEIRTEVLDGKIERAVRNVNTVLVGRGLEFKVGRHEQETPDGDVRTTWQFENTKPLEANTNGHIPTTAPIPVKHVEETTALQNPDVDPEKKLYKAEKQLLEYILNHPGLSREALVDGYYADELANGIPRNTLLDRVSVYISFIRKKSQYIVRDKDTNSYTAELKSRPTVWEDADKPPAPPVEPPAQIATPVQVIKEIPRRRTVAERLDIQAELKTQGSDVQVSLLRGGRELAPFVLDPGAAKLLAQYLHMTGIPTIPRLFERYQRDGGKDFLLALNGLNREMSEANRHYVLVQQDHAKYPGFLYFDALGDEAQVPAYTLQDLTELFQDNLEVQDMRDRNRRAYGRWLDKFDSRRLPEDKRLPLWLFEATDDPQIRQGLEALIGSSRGNIAPIPYLNDAVLKEFNAITLLAGLTTQGVLSFIPSTENRDHGVRKWKPEEEKRHFRGAYLKD